MVQILVQVRQQERGVAPHFEVLECDLDTSILQLKQKIQEAGNTSGAYSLPPAAQELVFMGERCHDIATLRDYGVCEPWIVQVAGFTVNPEEPGKRFVNGKLVPCSN